MRSNRFLSRTLHVEDLEQRCLLAIDAAIGASLMDSFGADAGFATTPALVIGAVHHGITTSSFDDDSAAPYTPAQITHAYGIDNIFFPTSPGASTFIPGDGTGQTIAIIDAYNQPHILSDLQFFDQTFGLPDPPQFLVVNQSGATSPLPSTDAASISGNWGIEISLDVEWAHAIAPKANILLVEANSNATANLAAAVTTARNSGTSSLPSLPAATIITMSYGSTTNHNNSSLYVTPSGKTGVTYMASTADSGLTSEWPAAYSNVLAVGGTSLFETSGSGYSSETGWSGGNGGTIPGSTRPSYQNGIIPFGSASSPNNRMTPDVSFDADPGTGVYIYDTDDFSAGEFVDIGGTSFSSPAWAGLIAIANQGRGAAGPFSNTTLEAALYADYTNGVYPYGFHDVTTTNNTNFSAGAGYDLSTGLGTPRADVLIPNLVGLSQTPTLSAPSGTVNTAKPPFSWSAVPGATSYHLTLIDTTNSTTVLNGLSVAGTSYTPTTGLTNGHNFQWSVQAFDSNGAMGPASSVLTFAVTTINHAPSGADHTATVIEEGTYTFTTADFGFSDPNDSPANTLLAVKITTLPAAGTLKDNNVAVSAGQFVSATDIANGLLKFTPALSGSDTSYASFTFQVEDNGGTANGGVNLDPTPKTMTINVTPINDAPSGANHTVTTLEETPYTFALADFGFSDPNDSPPNGLLAVKFTTLPVLGALTDNNVLVSFGGFVSATDIANGLVRFTPVPNGAGTSYTSFTFQVEDNGGTANGGVNLDPTPKTMTVNVTPVNDAPSGSDSEVVTLEDTPYTFDVTDFGFYDPNDSPQNKLLAVKFTTLPVNGALTDNGVLVNFGGFVTATDIKNGLLQFTPMPNGSGTPYTSFTFQVEDNGGTANGGVNLDPTPKTMAVDVTPVNDAPTGSDNEVVTLQNTPYSFDISDFGFYDPNDSPQNKFLALEITTLPLAGTLSDNGVPVSAGQFVAATDIKNGVLTFTPAPGASGDSYASFTFQVEDNGGTDNGGVDLDPAPKTMTVSVTPADVPPQVAEVLVDGSAWTGDYLTELQAAALGNGGYAIPAGSAQLQTLPWNDLDQIQIVFTEDVNVSQASLTLTGVNVPTYAISGFSYNPSTLTATWTLSSPIGIDRLHLNLASSGPAAVTSTSGTPGTPLAGAWTDQSSAFPSGSGGTASDFGFSFNVLPGDMNTDGVVNGLDLSQISSQWLASGNLASDVTGDGVTNGLDISAAAGYWLQSLPASGGGGSGADSATFLAAATQLVAPPAPLPATVAPAAVSSAVIAMSASNSAGISSSTGAVPSTSSGSSISDDRTVAHGALVASAPARILPASPMPLHTSTNVAPSSAGVATKTLATRTIHMTDDANQPSTLLDSVVDDALLEIIAIGRLARG